MGKESFERPPENVVTEIIEILEEDVSEEPQPTDLVEEEPISDTEAESDKKIRRKAGLKTLEEVTRAIQEAMVNPEATQR